MSLWYISFSNHGQHVQKCCEFATEWCCLAFCQHNPSFMERRDRHGSSTAHMQTILMILIHGWKSKWHMGWVPHGIKNNEHWISVPIASPSNPFQWSWWKKLRRQGMWQKRRLQEDEMICKDDNLQKKPFVYREIENSCIIVYQYDLSKMMPVDTCSYVYVLCSPYTLNGTCKSLFSIGNTSSKRSILHRPPVSKAHTFPLGSCNANFPFRCSSWYCRCRS